MALKLLAPTLILGAVFLLSWFLTNRFSLKLDFSQAFKSNTQPPPQPASGGISVVLNGVAGDHAVVGFTFPSDSTTTSSENLAVEQKNLDEIVAGLNQIETEQWEFLTNLPASIFRFDVILNSYPNSLNNAKKASYYLVTDQNGVVHKVLPGENITLAHGFKIADLTAALSKVHIKLVYDNGMYQNFYDPQGQLVSQATGALSIKPTIFLQLLIILGVWAFVVAFLLLVKQTILSSQDVREVIDFFQNSN